MFQFFLSICCVPLAQISHVAKNKRRKMKNEKPKKNKKKNLYEKCVWYCRRRLKTHFWIAAAWSILVLFTPIKTWICRAQWEDAIRHLTYIKLIGRSGVISRWKLPIWEILHFSKIYMFWAKLKIILNCKK